MSALGRMQQALNEVVRGQDAAIADMLTAFLARGHVLLEGVPGVAKTLLARSVAQVLGLNTTRIQFTPDLMPTDEVGTSVFRPTYGTFHVVRGPVFTDVLISDEINRTPPKTQAALLEAMEERQVSLDGTTHALSPFFFVVATQNPIELEGTYPLPEAQLDRFLVRVKVGYPDIDSERAMLEGFHARKGEKPSLQAVVSPQELRSLQSAAATLPCDGTLFDYVLRLVRASRDDGRVRLGASPRAAQSLLAAAKARAALTGQAFVTPDDVKACAPSVLGHRLLIKAEAEVEGLTADDVVRRLLDRVEVPR